MNNIQEILARTQQRIDEISQMKDKVYIVNAGITNNGKSSTFNSLLMLEGKCEPGQNVFKVQDIRTTVENQKAEYRKGVYLLDTPGLAATKSDEAIAKKAYQNASLIVFVHTIKKGELHEDELNWIQKIEKLLTPSYFSKHFCLVLTHRDNDLNDEQKELSSIQENIVNQLKNYCHLTAIPMFCISNSAFEKGVKDEKEALKKASRVAELKAFIDGRLPTYRTEQKERIDMMVAQVKAEAVKELERQKSMAEFVKNKRSQYARQHYLSFQNEVNMLTIGIKDAVTAYNEKSEKYKQAEREFADVERQYKAEKESSGGGNWLDMMVGNFDAKKYK